MNLDRDHSKDCAKPSVIGEKVHSGLRALNTVVGMEGKSITSEFNAFFDEAVLRQVAEICIDPLLCLRRAKIEVQAMRGRERVRLSCRLKNPLLKRSIQFHMSGLPGLLVWMQKAITDAPDTQFTRNTKSQAKKNHLAGWFFVLQIKTIWS
ncbi:MULTISPECIES: hypothetical protein [unclassified Pseudomonas]|uniref:hypothetical protein n=1 Tax=unclassified Pseudomonas TaxID=196821 RepID=UPI001179DD60|nr:MULTISPECIES: hypothetical protein [unclassified Pseudomonas]